MNISATTMTLIAALISGTAAHAASSDTQDNRPGEQNQQTQQNQNGEASAHGYQNPTGEDPQPRLTEETIENAHGDVDMQDEQETDAEQQ